MSETADPLPGAAPFPDRSELLTTSAATIQFMPRFVPDRIVNRPGGPSLRASIILLPRPDTIITPSEWALALSEALKSLKICVLPGAGTQLGWVGDAPADQWITVSPMADTSPKTTAILPSLWQSLMTPDINSAGLTEAHQSVLTAFSHTPHVAAFARHLRVMSFAAQGIKIGADPNSIARFSQPGASFFESDQSGLRVFATKTSALARALVAADAARLRVSVHRARALRGDKNVPAAPGDYDPSFGMLDLLAGPRNRAVTSLPKTFSNKAPPTEGDELNAIVYGVGHRGLAKAISVTSENDKAREMGFGEKPFLRDAPAPRPEPRLATTLVDLLGDIRGVERKVALEFSSTSSVAAALVKEKAEIANLREKHTARLGLSSQFTDLQFDLTTALARHMSVMRAPPATRWNGVKPALDKIDPATAVELLEDLAEAGQRRLFGLLQYGALARALHLIVDIEIPLTKLPSFAKPVAGQTIGFIAAASVGGATKSALWTHCQHANGGMSIVGTSEQADATGARFEGYVNLAERVANEPRYDLISLDTDARAEQTINSAKADSTDQGSALAGPRGSQGRALTAGIVILDTHRREAVQAEDKRATDHSAALSAGQAVVLHAEDLSTGLRYDVAVSPRNAENDSYVWRSLMQREVKFGRVTAGGSSVDLEALVAAAMRFADPNDPMGLRRRLDEGKFKPVGQIVALHERVPGQSVEAADIIAAETIGVWDGSPLGAPCGQTQVDEDGKKNASKSGKSTDLPALDDMTSLPVDATISLPRKGAAALPPHLEFGRPMLFAVRDCYLGGVGADAARSQTLLGGSPAAIPKLSLDKLGSQGMERHDRIGVPDIAEIAPEGRKRPGDTVDKLIVRSGAETRFQTAVCRRILIAPSVAQSFAQLHPSPKVEPGKPATRALDHIPVLQHALHGHRTRTLPTGGLVNVMFDPKIGGFPVRRKGRLTLPSKIPPAKPRQNPEKPSSSPTEPLPERVFKVVETSAVDLGARDQPYYPDPATDALLLRLWSRYPVDQPIPGFDAVRVPLYDPTIYQAVPEDWPAHRDRGACVYPFALPLLIEVVAVSAKSPLQIDAQPQVGTLDADGRFTSLRKGRRPAYGTVTVQRVVVRLPKGYEIDLHIWGRTAAEAANYMAMVNAAVLLEAAELDDHAMRADAMQSVLSDMPVPEQAEVQTVSLAHAVQRPASPRFNTRQRIVPYVLRINMGMDKWPTFLASHSVASKWDDESAHEVGATQCWFGGALLVDRRVAADLTLAFTYSDVRDVPGQKFDVQKDGSLKFPRRSLGTITKPLERPPVAEIIVAGKVQPVDLLNGDKGARGLMLNAPDSRAYRVEVRPSSISHFLPQMTSDKTENPLFTVMGESYEFWLPATRRPDQVGEVEVVKAFVWSTSVGSVSRRSIIRLIWRRPNVGKSTDPVQSGATGNWFSSGEGEVLGVTLALNRKDQRDYGLAAKYISHWGSDPIRDYPDDRTRPDWVFDRSRLPGERSRFIQDQWMLLPGEGDGAGTAAKASARACKIDLVTYTPQYDETQDAWWVDIDFDPGMAATPYVTLGLVRYQPNAKRHATLADQDLRVSKPISIDFPTLPLRTVVVRALPRDKVSRSWPVRIQVLGPLGIVRGGVDGPEALPDPQLRERLARITRPRFKLSVLHRVNGLGSETEEEITNVQSNDDLPPSGAILWERLILLTKRPNARTSIFIEEVDLMLNANADEENSNELVETGPRFMAKIAIGTPKPAARFHGADAEIRRER